MSSGSGSFASVGTEIPEPMRKATFLDQLPRRGRLGSRDKLLLRGWQRHWFSQTPRIRGGGLRGRAKGRGPFASKGAIFQIKGVHSVHQGQNS